ncbi:MAG: hypothetical protein ACSLEY_03745 [Candidatus Saccharimonadales bacterium]
MALTCISCYEEQRKESVEDVLRRIFEAFRSEQHSEKQLRFIRFPGVGKITALFSHIYRYNGRVCKTKHPTSRKCQT